MVLIMKKFIVLLPLFALLTAFQQGTKPPEIPAEVQGLLQKHGCVACHYMTLKVVGPSWLDIAAKKYTAKRISALIKTPEPGNWPGFVPMLAQANIPKTELATISKWLANLK